MKVIEVIPIIKGLARPTLSYFTKDKFEPGSFVRIPLRKGSAYGIVASSTDAHKAKASIKDANYQLRKLSAIEKAGKISQAFMRAVDETAEYYATTTGSVLSSLLPKMLMESPELIKKPYKEVSGPPQEVKLVQLGRDERFREYRSIVRENFARNQSVLFIVPTRDEALMAAESLSTGIERYVYTAVQKNPKVIRKLLTEAQENKHPILFITTQSWISFDRRDLCTFILEKENSRSYRTLSRPYINLKVFLEKYARAKGATLILGDSILSLESLWREREGSYSEFSPLTWRLKTSCEAEMVDMRAKREFEILSPRLVEAVGRAVALGKNVFIYAARKGFSSTTICGDCASLLLCKNCGAPVVLLDTPVYICRHCKAMRSAETRCDNCQSWKLTPLGVGIDRVAEEARKIFENTPVFVMDKDKTSTSMKARSLIKKFNGSGGAILVGTDLALSHLESVPMVAVCSLDSLFSVPDFCINERIFYLVTRLREMARERFVIQTRNAGQEVLEFATAGNILDFYRTEMKEREGLRYPPFSIFIKASTEDDRERIERKAAHLQSLFKDYEPHFMLENKGAKSKRTLSMILRFERDKWPIEDVAQKLLLLTPDFEVKVDPESIL